MSAEQKTTDDAVMVRDLPIAVRLVIDALMLRSTVPTAVMYGLLWAAVIVHIAWQCDRLAFIGLRSPAAEAQQQLQWTLGNDAEYFYGVLCRMPDGIAREEVSEHYARVQAEYKYVSGGSYATVQPCPGAAAP